MRLTNLVIIASLVAGTSAFGEPPTPREIVDRAIKAVAEKPDDLAKRRVERIIMDGVFSNGMDTPMAREVIAEGPDHVRYNNLLKSPQGEQRIILSLNGNRGWRTSTDMPVQELNLTLVDEFQAEAHGRWVSTLLPLINSKYPLTALLDSRVDGEDVHVIKAAARFRPEVLLFFSKSTGLLAKISYKTTENGVAVRKEQLYGDYKKFDGLLLPGKIADIVNDNRVGDYKVKEYKFGEKHPAGIFEKIDVK